LDRIGTALGKDQFREALQRLTDRSITYITFDDSTETMDLHDAVLHCELDGSWKW